MIAETSSIGTMVQGLPSLQSFNGSTTRKINILPSCYHTLLVVLSARMFRRIKSFVLNYSDSWEYFSRVESKISMPHLTSFAIFCFIVDSRINS